MKRRIFALLMSLCILACSTAVATVKASDADDDVEKWDGTVATAFDGGSGTEDDPYQIATGAQLAYLASLINGSSNSSYCSCYYVLTADINLNSKSWTPIGRTAAYSFKGTFDGGGHTISNLYMSSSAFGGLFGMLNEATIMNVTLTKCDITGSTYAGGIVGYASATNSTVIQNCTVSGSVSCVQNSTSVCRVGGIVGNGNSTTLINCVNEATVTASNSGTGEISVGGLAGYISTGTISSGCNTGIVTVSACGGTSVYAGGLVGGAYAVSVSDACNTGSVTANLSAVSSVYAGGLFGQIEGKSTVTVSYNTGSVTAVAKTYVFAGGIAGDNGSSAAISNTYNAGTVSGTSNSSSDVGGLTGNNYGTVQYSHNVGAVSGSAKTINYVGGVAGNSTGSISNTYYLSTTASAGVGGILGSGRVVSKTADEFASGEVAYLLNGSVSGGTTWYQNLDNGETPDSYPVLSSSSGKVYYGTNCGGTAVYSNSTVPAAEHSWDDGEVTTAATCTEGGVKTYTCTVCNETYTEPIPATGHTTEIQHAKDATCTENGYTGDEVCAVCGETITTGETIPATGHTTETQNAKAATCTEDGYTGDEICTVCGETIATGEPIPATGHTLKYAVSETDENVIVETCTDCDHKATATITAGDAVYTGEAIETASVYYSDDWQGGELAISYTDNVNAGTATASITAGEITAYVTFNISKASQNAPTVATDENPDGISVTDETVDGKADGSITGVTTGMEYRAEGEDEYIAVTGETIENLADGTYYIRYAGDENHEPSAEVAVTVGSGEKLIVTFIVDGETCATYQVSWGESLTEDEFPAIPEKTGYDQTAPTWDTASLTDITENTTVTAVYTINTYTVTVPEEQTGYTLSVDKSVVEWGEDVTLTFELAEGYTESEDFAIMVNGAAVDLVDGKYIISTVEADVIITVSGIEEETEEPATEEPTTEEPTTETPTTEEEAEQTEATATDANTTETTANGGSSLKTADTDMVYVWIAMLLGASMITVFLAKKRVQE